MRKFILKSIIMLLMVYIPVISINYFVDPANIYHDDIVVNSAKLLNAGNIIESPKNMDEGLLQVCRMQELNYNPDTVIIGSSHVMYIPFECDGMLYNAGMSGSYLGDYYAIVGLIESKNIMPKRIMIGVDPWAFMRSADDGRHSRLDKYSRFMLDLVKDRHSELQDIEESDMSKLKEIVSFSYFQSSVARLRNMKGDALQAGGHIRIAVADNAVIGEAAKILPDGRRIPSAKEYHDIETLQKEALQYIASKRIYQLENGFRDVQQDNLKDFKRLLKFLTTRGVDVHIYLPAWYPSVYEYFKDDDNFSGVLKIEEAIREIGNEMNIPVHGGYDPKECNLTEKDYMDWLHLKPEKMLENYNYIRG